MHTLTRHGWIAAFLLMTLSFFSGVQGDEKRPFGRPPSFPCRSILESRYKAFQGKLPAVDVIQSLLQEDMEGQNLAPWGENRYTSVWAGVDRRLAAEKETASTIAKLQEEEARVLLEPALRSGDFSRIISTLRRHPRAPAVQEALVEAGEQELRRGHTGTARRCFLDALTRSSDPAVRERAQVGVWLSLEDPAALESAFEGVKPDQQYPFLGERLKASAIRERLSNAERPSPAALKLADLERRTLHTPSSPTWLCDQPGAHDEGVVVAGPNLIAWFTPEAEKPRWSLTHPQAASTMLHASLAPGPFHPAVARGRLFSRWGVELMPGRVRQPLRYHQLTHVAAFDLQSGAMLWSTARDAAWDEVVPVSDPTYADGRLYVMAVGRKDEYAPIYLVCLDADSGAVQWKRELATATITLAPGPIKGRRPANYYELDVTHFGNAVTVEDGAVYCQTNAGLVARCDARDGLVEWIRTYPRDSGTAPFLTLARRQGAAPIVHGRQVIFLPRDALAVYALDRDSGEIVWNKENDGSFHALGTVKEQVLLADSRSIYAVNGATGKPGWERRFDSSIDARVTLAHGAVYVGTSAKLYRLNGESGEVQEEQDWNAPEGLTGLTVRGKSLFAAVKGLAVSLTPTPAATTRPIASGQAVRTIFQENAPVAFKGDPHAWDKENTFAWKAGNAQGKRLLAHDGANLYIGLACAQIDAQPRRGLGPFPNPDERGHQTIFPPEAEPVDLTRSYDGLPGKLRWKQYESMTDKIDLVKVLDHNAAAVAYAVSWVHSDRAEPVLVQVGSDDGIKVWVNREVAPAQNETKVELKAGWNEVLVKIDNRPVPGRWAFYFELRQPDGVKLPASLRFQATPPVKGHE